MKNHVARLPLLLARVERNSFRSSRSKNGMNSVLLKVLVVLCSASLTWASAQVEALAIRPCPGLWASEVGNGSSPVEASERSVKGLQLRVSANGRHFVDQEGKPFFYLGDTAWLLFQRLDRQEVDEYLKDRAAKGFTVIQAYVLRGLEARHPDGATSLIGEKPLIDRDPTRPNEAFFKNVDYVINRANELALVMCLVVSQSWHVNKNTA